MNSCNISRVALEAGEQAVDPASAEEPPKEAPKEERSPVNLRNYHKSERITTSLTQT